jgi:hypothetical protein
MCGKKGFLPPSPFPIQRVFSLRALGGSPQVAGVRGQKKSAKTVCLYTISAGNAATCDQARKVIFVSGPAPSAPNVQTFSLQPGPKFETRHQKSLCSTQDAAGLQNPGIYRKQYPWRKTRRNIARTKPKDGNSFSKIRNPSFPSQNVWNSNVKTLTSRPDFSE